MPQQDRLYLQLFLEGWELTKIARVYGVSPDSVRRMIQRAKAEVAEIGDSSVLEDPSPDLEMRSRPAKTDGKTPENLAAIRIPENAEIQTEVPITIRADNALVLGDLHIPYHNRLMLQRAIYVCRNFYPEVKTVIFGGDTFNFGSLSDHIHNGPEDHSDPSIRVAGGVMRAVMEYFDQAFICNGNHDERVSKRLNETFRLDLLISAAFGRNWPNCEVKTTNLDYLYLGDQWMIVHPSKYSGLGGKTPSEMAELYQRNVVSLHNHIIGISQSKTGRFIGVDSGHLTDPEFHYYMKRRATTFTRWNSGFTIISRGYATLFTEAFTDWAVYES